MKMRSYLLLMLMVLLSSCNKGSEQSIDDITVAVWEYSQLHPDGFTVIIPQVQPVTQGISVAFEATQNSFGMQGLRFVVQHALLQYRTVGGWLNEDNELYYYDSVKIFADDETEEAMQFARENKQIAIYDITNDCTIYVNGVE